MPKFTKYREPTTGTVKAKASAECWFVVYQKDETAPQHVDALSTREKAERVSDGCHRDGYEVHYISKGEAAL